MSKQTKRKITVELPKAKELQTRPSVFERLGTKRTGQITQQISLIQTQIPQTEVTGISNKPPTPPKETSAPVEENKGRLHSAVVVREEDDAEWDSWNQTDLEKRRQQLCRELGMAMEASKKKKKPIPSSSSSSRSSSSGSASTSSSGSNSSSSSSPRRKKVKKTVKSKRNSSSSSGSDRGSRRKKSKLDLKRDKSNKSKVSQKKDTNKSGKKLDSSVKKKVTGKSVLNKKSLSPPKKTSGTPPINKNIPKGYILSKRAHSKSPKKDKNRSPSPHSKEKARDRERRERDRDRDRERRRSKSPKNKARSRSPLRRHGSHPRDPRRKSSRGPSPKRGRQDDKHRNKRSPSRDDKRKDHKDRSLERRKHDDKERYDRDRKDREQRFDREAQREKEREEALARCQERQRERERLKEQQNKREQEKRPRGRQDRDRGLDKGLEKPTPDKPVERLLPRPEERLAALAATNRNLGRDRAISSNRDRSETRPDHNTRKGDRPADGERKRPAERRSVERHDRNEYSMDRSYDHSLERNYDRSNERYDEIDAIGERPDHSPSGFPPGHEHYDSPYEHSRGYGDQEEHSYDEHIDERHEERRNRDRRDDRSWDGRENSVDPDRPYIHHSMKDWDNDDYHGDWNRQDRHWQHRDQHHDWNDKDRDEGSWHHRQVHSGSGSSSRGRPHDENYRGRLEHSRGDQGSRTENRVDSKSKRSRDVPAEPSDSKKGTPTQSQSNATAQPEISEDPPIPDDLSEISDDPDEILNREDDQTMETTDLTTSVPDTVDHYGLQPFKPDYEPMIEQEGEKMKANSSESPRNSELQLTNSVNKETKETDKEKVESQEQNDGEDGLDNLDFEEISDGELEEDQRAKGLSDALGVDWASLVAEVRGKKPSSSEDAADKEAKGPRQHWEPKKVMARIGVSVYMAGKSFVEEIFSEKDETKETQENGESTTEQTYKPAHPVASMQVAMERKKNQRVSLFGTNKGFSKALSARQDLALRRHLCNLPINEGGHEIESPDPQIFAMAQRLLQQA